MRQCSYKKFAKTAIREAIAFNRCEREQFANKDITWKDISAVGGIVAVVSSEIESYDLVTFYMSKLQKRGIKIDAVIQATEETVEKHIKEYEVGNLWSITDQQRNDCFFVVFDMDNYEDICDQLKKHGIASIANFYCLEEKEIGKIQRLLWTRQYAKKYYTRIVSFYLYNRMYRHTKNQWREFVTKSKEKKVFIWGAGVACKQFLQRYFYRIPVEMIVDNEKNRWGSNIYGVKIASPDCMKKYNPDEVIILVTPLRCDNILQQVKELGYKNCYSFMEMEAHRLRYFFRRPSFAIKRKISEHMPKILFYLFRIFPIAKKKIVFSRHNGKGFGCHEKYVALEILKRKLQYKMIWLADNPYEIYPDGITVVENTLKNQIYHLVTAEVWFDDGSKPTWTRKRKGQFFINTLHGTGISLKKFGLDDGKNIQKYIIDNFINDEKISDVYLAASKNIAEIYKTAFRYNGEVMLCGSPRVDILLNSNEKQREEIRREVGLQDGERLILYAPTFIKDKESVHGNKVYDLNFPVLCGELEKKTGEKWKGAVRLHPLDRSIENIRNSALLGEEEIKNFTDYPDVQELLLAADILITDYSSIMFDMGYALKKVVLYVPDLEEYLEKERELYIDIRTLPFPICYDVRDVLRCIEEWDEEEYCKEVKEFNDRHGVLEDGKASERVVDFVESIL